MPHSTETEAPAAGPGRPTLSVVMSNYNHARFLPLALESVLGQSFRPKEIIIIDDASTDDSVEVIERYARDEPLIRFIRNERNMGILHNLARLLELATGDYLVGCACDDALLPGFAERSMGLLSRYPEAGLCSTLSLVMDEDGGNRRAMPALVVSDRPAYLPPERVRRLLLTYGNWMLGSTTVYRRDRLLEAGGFLPELRSFTDNFASQVLALKHGACFIPEPLALWRKMDTTYAAKVHANADAFQAMVASAATLMRNRYEVVFPPAYVRLWEREIRFQNERLKLRAHLGDAGPGRRLHYLLGVLYLLVKYRPVQTIRSQIRRRLGAFSARPAAGAGPGSVVA